MTIGVAILGAGIGRDHLEAFLALPDLFDVRLIVDRDVERASAIAASAGIPVSPDIDTALSHNDVDFIDICLPPYMHVPVTLDGLRAGKNVICEKPLATSLADLDRVSAGMISANRSVYPVFQYRWGPSCAALRHLIDSGLTGDPVMATVETHWSRNAEYYANDWRGTWRGEQGGAVLSHAIHNHDLLRHFFGDVWHLSAFATTRVNPIETEDCVSIALEMASGALATSSVTLGHSTNETRFRFVYEHLTATSGPDPYVPGRDGWSFVARHPADQERIDAAIASVARQPSGFLGFFSELWKDTRGLQNSSIRFEDGRASIEFVTAFYHAARTGERVSLPLDADHPLYEGWQPNDA